MSSLPDTRQQSFDEIYGPPENFLEIEVRLNFVLLFVSFCYTCSRILLPFPPPPLSLSFALPLLTMVV